MLGMDLPPFSPYNGSVDAEVLAANSESEGGPGSPEILPRTPPMKAHGSRVQPFFSQPPPAQGKKAEKCW